MEDHIEPISGLPLLGAGRVRDASKPRGWRTGIVVLSQVYTAPSCQDSIYELGKQLLSTGKFQALLVEGDAAHVDAAYAEAHGSGRKLDAPVASGVLKLVTESKGDFSARAIDEPQLVAEQGDVQRECGAGETRWKAVTSHFQHSLARAKEMAGYTADMHFVSDFLADRAGRGSLSASVTRLVKIGCSIGVEPESLPVLRTFIAATLQETQLDFAAVERERAEFVRALADCVRQAVHAPGQAGPDMTRILAALRFWLLKTDLSEDGLSQAVESRGFTRVAQECETWLLKFIFESALKFRSKQISHAAFHHDLVALALRLGVDVLRYEGLMRYVEYVETAAAVSVGQLYEQMEGYAADVMRGLLVSEAQAEVHALDRQIFVLARAGLLKLTPQQATAFHRDVTWARVAQRLEGYAPLPKSLELGGGLQRLTQAALRFTELSRLRARVMTEAAVKHAAAGGALLVCGGFHEQAITRLLEARFSDVAWSTITPTIASEDMPDD